MARSADEVPSDIIRTVSTRVSRILRLFDWLDGVLKSGHRAGCREPKKLARQLALVFQGAVVNGQTTRDAASAQAAKAAAKVLVEAALP